jgi:hypothetical protein
MQFRRIDSLRCTRVERLNCRQRAGAAAVVRRLAAPAIAAFVLGAAVPVLAAPRGESAITCTNPASGASWQIRINYLRSTVDSNPARISDAEIWWHDAKNGGNYTLDRKSGKLTIVFASSTGGSFLWDRCRLEN